MRAQVGRAAPADVLIAVPTVSSHHAMLRVSGAAREVLVTDLGSTNSTFIDGRELAPMEAVRRTPVEAAALLGCLLLLGVAAAAAAPAPAAAAPPAFSKGARATVCVCVQEQLTIGSEVTFGDQFLAAFRLDFEPDDGDESAAAT